MTFVSEHQVATDDPQELFVIEFESDESSLVSVSVLSPTSTIFSDHGKAKIKTAFTATEAGPHWLCMQNDNSGAAEVRLKILAGPQAKDYSRIAKKEHLEDTQVVADKVLSQFSTS